MDMEMDMDLPNGPRQSSAIPRRSNGCWTCRLRRKKCDEKQPACDGCAALHITCYYYQDKPEWMDGGVRQEEMAERVKREVKEKAHLRRGKRAVHVSGDGISVAETSNGQKLPLPGDLATPMGNLLNATPDVQNGGLERCSETSTILFQRGADCTLTGKGAREGTDFRRAETILLMFYLEQLFPFMYPFYCPSLLQGGRAWVLEMMISSPVVRQATLCQSSYFFTLSRCTAPRDFVWETVLTKTKEAFEVLRQSLQVLGGSSITEHLHGAVRTFASIMQVQRFEIAILSFNNCQAHLNAALALFRQLLDHSGTVESVGPTSSFNTVISRLGTTSWIIPTHYIEVQSAEQAAFRFSSALLILDDIISSTVLQEQPRLYGYHRSLLGYNDGTEPAIDLEAAVGCQNWALLHIGEIAVLDAWKQRCKRAGNLDVMELVHRATAIKYSLEANLTRLENDLIVPKERGSLLDVFTDHSLQSKTPASQSSLVTRVWAHAALLYLSVVVSGWQPASLDVRYNVRRVELLIFQITPPALLRTMVWPFCVAGCLSEPAQEARYRDIVEALQPPSVFGTVRKALEIMESVWRNRNAGDATSRDLFMCFRSQSDLVLLV